MHAQTNVVLVHGWAGSAESWEPVVRLLSKRGGFVTHGIRLPGSPGSGSGSGSGEPTIPSAAASLLDLLRTFPRPAVIVGHSMGAQVTLRAHAAAPGLVATEIVIDPAYAADRAERSPMERWAEDIELRGHDAVEDFFLSAAGSVRRGDLRRIRSDMLRTPPSVIARYLRSEYVDPDAVGLLPATAEVAASRTRPVLALHSSPTGAERERALPQPERSRVDVWPGFGHYLHLEAPDLFVTVLAEWVSDARVRDLTSRSTTVGLARERIGRDSAQEPV